MKLIALAAVAGLSLHSAHAVQYSFKGVNADEVDVSAQLALDVTSSGGGVLFEIKNMSGPTDFFVGDVFFDMPSPHILVRPPTLVYAPSQTVLYKAKTSGAFPEGTSISFGVDPSSQFTKKGGAENAIDSGEQLGLLFGLLDGTSFDTVIAALNSGDLRIGLHVQGFSGGGSDSYVSVPRANVPDGGATMVLLGVSLLGLAGIRSKISGVRALE